MEGKGEIMYFDAEDVDDGNAGDDTDDFELYTILMCILN